MTLAVIGSLFNLVAALAIAAGGEMPSCGFVMVPSALVSLIGCFVAGSGSKKVGAYMIIGGAILFVPAGLVAAFGGKRILNEVNEEEFKAELDDEESL